MSWQPPNQPPSGPSAQGGWGPPGGYAAQGPPAGQLRLAGFFIRAVGAIIDSLIISVIIAPALIYLFVGETEIEPCTVDASGEIDITGTLDNALCEVPTSSTIAITVGLAAVLSVLAFGLVVVMDGRGGSPGKRAVGIRLVGMDYRPIGTGRALGRAIVRIFSGAICYLGYLWMLWDPNKQTWHDKAVSSIVVTS